jgi:DNA-binding GntR family transcriptional regulator
MSPSRADATILEPPPPSIHDRIRDGIVSGRLGSGERLKVADLARRFGTSTNPVREALQQLCGEGLVAIEPNRGARVVPIDEDFVRDVVEIEALIEPALTRWFVGISTEADIDRLQAIQGEIEALNFADLPRHGELDTRFHQVIYDRHYNRLAAGLWWRHREVLRAISARYPTSLRRRAAILAEHRDLIDAIRAQDADRAASIIATHVEGSGRHIIAQMRLANASAPRPPSRHHAERNPG